MSLATDLLDQAEHLVGLDPRRPKQANLRRAISTAYYALFHLLCADAAAALVPGRELRNLLARAFSHTDMKKACRPFAAGTIPDYLKPAAGQTVSADLRTVAKAFIELQEKRHEADYDPSAVYTRVNAADLVHSARAAFAAWSRVRSTQPAAAFRAALLVGDRWNRS